MKKRYYLSSLLILFIGLFFFQSCKQEVSEPDKPVVLSSEKEIISYSVTIAEQSYEGKIDSENREITIKDVPYDCKIENLKPSFNISDKAKISINNQNQKSGVSSVDFSNPVIYSVTAEDGSKAEWTVKLIQKEKPKYTLILHMNYPEAEKPKDIYIHEFESQTITLPKLPLAGDKFTLEEDYTFLGWSKVENAEKADYRSNVDYAVRCDTELWGVWKKNTASYTVKVFKQKLNDSYSDEPDETIKAEGVIGKEIEYDLSSYPEFFVDEDRTKSVTISADGSSSVNVYLKRKTASYIVKYYKAKTDGTYADTEDDCFTAFGKVGSVVIFDNNKYVGFKIDTEKTNAENVIIKEDNSTVLNVYYCRIQINYLVKHFVENADSDSYTLDSSESKTGIYGSEMEYQVKDFGEHISFEKVEYSSSDKTVSEDSYVNVYYKLDTVTFTYKWNITYMSDTVKTFKYGQSVSNPYVPSRTLYSFRGWTPSVPSTATENTVFEAQWTCLAGTRNSMAPSFIIDLPESIYVKTPVVNSSVYLSAYVTHNYQTYYSLYESEDGINWFKTGTIHQLGGSGNYKTVSLPITINQDNSDAYYCIAVSKTSNGNCSYSKICKIITNPEDTENIGSYYYSDGTYSVELDTKKTVVGVVASLKEDKSPKMIIPSNYLSLSGKYAGAEEDCENYSYKGISDWKLPDFIELQSILFNTKALNNSLDSIGSLLMINSYAYNQPLFYWAKSETGNASDCSFAVYIDSISYIENNSNKDCYYSLDEKSVSLNGYYIPVKVIE